eukprot:3936595-Rhodomonas_salina.1
MPCCAAMTGALSLLTATLLRALAARYTVSAPNLHSTQAETAQNMFTAKRSIARSHALLRGIQIAEFPSISTGCA